jgi:hypothetical protein
VLRDSNGSFAGNVMSASFFSGDGSNLTSINATSITTGTLATGRLTGPYTGVTGVGTLTVGTWNANVISAQYGGTGSANLTANNVLLGNGASTVQVVAPGTANNVLTSNGTTWISQAPTGGGGGGGTTRTVTDYTATNGQTTFSVSYTVGLLDVFRNGVKLAASDVTATNGTSFTIAACTTGDIVQAVAYTSLNVAATITTDTFSGNGVQTTFIMSVAPANPASVLVAISGVVQAPATYSVSTTSLIFSDPPPSGSNNISARFLGIPSAGSGLTISDDTTTNAARYLAFTSATSGSITTQNVSSTKLLFNPSTGVLGATGTSVGGGSAAAPSITFTGDTNTGIFSPAADTIAFSEGGTEQMRLNSAGDLQMNSGYGSVATAYGCRAWVNFNGTGTPAIRASGNVSSITDNAQGSYTVNFTTAMPDINYSQIWAAGQGSGAGNYFTTTIFSVPATSNCGVRCTNQAGNQEDPSFVTFSAFR